MADWSSHTTECPSGNYAWVRHGLALKDFRSAQAEAAGKGAIISWRYDHPSERPGCLAAHVSSAGRTNTLTAALTALAMGTLVPGRVAVFLDGPQDDPQQLDHALRLLAEVGCSWTLHATGGCGQVANHIRACELLAAHPIAFRLDDDTVPHSGCLRTLAGAMGEGVFAAAPMAPQSLSRRPKFDPEGLTLGGLAAGKPNAQWTDLQGPPVEAEHLHCSFVYRPQVALRHYPRHLSRVGHREETWMSNSAWRDGWKLLVVPGALTLHVRAGSGGIRDGHLADFDRDEALWQRRLELLKGMEFGGGCYVPATFGLGDVLAFDEHIAPVLRDRYRGPVRLGYNTAVPTKNCVIVPMADALVACNPQDPRAHNPYHVLGTSGGLAAGQNFWERWAEVAP